MKHKFLLAGLMLLFSLSLCAKTDQGSCGTNLMWWFYENDNTYSSSPQGTLLIKGTGPMTDNKHEYASQWASYKYNIKTVTIENGATTIGTYAFSAFLYMTSVEIPNSVTIIGDYAFYHCTSLPSIDIPNSITGIGASTFSGCSGLASVTIGSSVTSIGDGAFSDCSSLTSVEIPNSVTGIGASAFSGCSGLASVTISGSVTSIGDDAFFGCSRLTSVNLSDIEAWCNITFSNDVANPLFYAHDLYQHGTLVTDLVIPNSVTSIGKYAFYSCNNLTSIEIPNSVTSIGNFAFYACSGLTFIEIPNSVKNIGASAFKGLTFLDNVSIGNGIVTDGISDYAFANSPYLTSVTCKAAYPPVINSTVFEGCGVLSQIDLYVPKESVKRYQKADVWSEFNIIGTDFPNEDDPSNPEDGKYTITWQDEDGNVIKTDEVEQDATPVYTGTIPTKAATNEYTYEFAGWLPKIQPATKDICYTTFFERNKIETPVYTVNINGENCSLNISNQYPEGAVITVEAVADECFEFQQWSDGNKDNPRTITITANTNLTAEFNKVRYTVTGQPSTGGKVQIRKQ